jgi:hypothetical protein
VQGGGKTFEVPTSYDALNGYHVSLSAAEKAALSGGGTVRIRSTWGFDSLESPPMKIVTPRPAAWSLQNGPLVMGQTGGTLTFTDGGAGVGSCVQSVAVKDATGNTIPVTDIQRDNDSVTVTLDPENALGPSGSATVSEANGITSAPLAVTLLPPMPHVTRAIAYLPKGILVLQGTGLKYINTVVLERTGITFGAGSPNPDGTWTFSTQHPAPYQAAWEHETMAISYTLQAPDTRSAAAQADVQYAPN